MLPLKHIFLPTLTAGLLLTQAPQSYATEDAIGGTRTETTAQPAYVISFDLAGTTACQGLLINSNWVLGASSCNTALDTYADYLWLHSTAGTSTVKSRETNGLLSLYRTTAPLNDQHVQLGALATGTTYRLAGSEATGTVTGTATYKNSAVWVVASTSSIGASEIGTVLLDSKGTPAGLVVAAKNTTLYAVSLSAYAEWIDSTATESAESFSESLPKTEEKTQTTPETGLASITRGWAAFSS
ncbi:MAG: trypsin-like serine protease [Corynebacterium sp.]|nr:trypsin-like serine protease [Corynebacterium sp.]